MLKEYQYLAHYGVLGMKWGVRKARRAYRKENPKGYKNSTGKNYDQAMRDYNKETKAWKKDYSKQRKNLDSQIKFLQKQNKRVKNDKIVKSIYDLNEQYKGLESRETLSKEIIDKRYKDRFNEAKLKDINYEDVERGMDILRRRGISL